MAESGALVIFELYLQPDGHIDAGFDTNRLPDVVRGISQFVDTMTLALVSDSERRTLQAVIDRTRGAMRRAEREARGDATGH